MLFGLIDEKPINSDGKKEKSDDNFQIGDEVFSRQPNRPGKGIIIKFVGQNSALVEFTHTWEGDYGIGKQTNVSENTSLCRLTSLYKEH